MRDKQVSGDVSAFGTTNDGLSCDERRTVLVLHQFSFCVAGLDREPTATCFSVYTEKSTTIAAASLLDRENENAWYGLVKARRHDLCELCFSAYSPMAAVGGRGTQPALDIFDAQRPRHVLGTRPRLFKISSEATNRRSRAT